jgi:hypothetical protein
VCEQAQPPRTGSGTRLYGAISSAGYIDSPRVPAALYKDRSGLRTPHAAPPSRSRAIEDEDGVAGLLGRGVAVDIPLIWDSKVSGVHAELERIGDDWAIVDDGLSRNGTYLNGQRVQSRRRRATAIRSASGTRSLSIASRSTPNRARRSSLEPESAPARCPRPSGES